MQKNYKIAVPYKLQKNHDDETNYSFYFYDYPIGVMC